MEIPYFKFASLSFLLSAGLFFPALPCFAASVRGELVWKCDFTPDEAAQYGVAGCRPDEAGRGASYEANGGAGGDG